MSSFEPIRELWLEHLVEYDPRLAKEPVVLDGELLLPELDSLQNAKGEVPIVAGLSTGTVVGQLPEAGTPYAVSSEGIGTGVIFKFVTAMRSQSLSKLSIRHYLHDIRKFERFLSASGLGLLEATDDDIAAYRRVCIDGDSQFRLQRASWIRSEAALSRFYVWASGAGLLPGNAPLCRVRRKGDIKEPAIKMIPLADYVEFRNFALLSKDEVVGARYPLRDAAYAEWGITTGMRQTEKAALLVCELPKLQVAQAGGRKLMDFKVAERTAKYGKSRVVPLPVRVLTQFVMPYIREERTLLVERWRRSGGPSEPTNVYGWLDGSGRVHFRGQAGRPRDPNILTPQERWCLVLLPDSDADPSTGEPAALWLNQLGRPMRPQGWAAVLRRASERFSASRGREIWITDHMLRHSFAVHWLTRLIRASLQANQNIAAEYLRDRTSEVYYKIVSDPLRRLQRWMGHSSFITTQIYLNYTDEAVEQIELANEIFETDLYVGAK